MDASNKLGHSSLVSPRPGPVRQTQALAAKRSVSPHVRRLSESLDCECLGLLRSPARTMKQNLAAITTHGSDCPHVALKTVVHTVNGVPTESVSQSVLLSPCDEEDSQKPASKENSEPSSTSTATSSISSTPSPTQQQKP